MSEYRKFDDAYLTNLLIQKDHGAFSEIYRRYWHKLFLHAYKMIKDEDEAKDIVQDVFVGVWNSSSTINITSNIKGYLYITARNRILNRIKQSKCNDDFIGLLANEITGVDETTTDLINERDLQEIIDNEVDKLPPRMKQVFQLSREKFLTHKQIAEQLGTSEETVKKQISGALKILRGKLDKFGGLSVLLLEFLRYRS
jgi:RNA polymerase sigma-70 factor (family 1)